jgi:DNA-binding transcriptional MerR regulator
VKPYVLRYWESEFPLVRPQKSRSGQRLYQRKDIEALLRIKQLLYGEKYTVSGAKRRLQGPRPPDDEQIEMRFEGNPPPDAPVPAVPRHPEAAAAPRDAPVPAVPRHPEAAAAPRDAPVPAAPRHPEAAAAPRDAPVPAAPRQPGAAAAPRDAPVPDPQALPREVLARLIAEAEAIFELVREDEPVR